MSFTPKSVSGLGDFGLLAPSIVLKNTIEADFPLSPYHAGTLLVAGTFGTNLPPDPDSKVTVGGLGCPVQADGWHPDYILCDLPGGTAGYVVVTVRKHDSNKGRLTKWTGTFRYTILGDDSLRVDATYRVAFRGDIRKFRPVIHDPPVGSIFSGFNLIPDESSASFVCSGSAVRSIGDATITVAWTGTGNLSGARVMPPPANFFQIQGNIIGSNVSITTLHGGIADATPGCTGTEVIVYPDMPPIILTGHDTLVVPLFDIGALATEPGDPSFPASSRNLTGDLNCAMSAIFSPPQCRMEWDDIRAQFPPDPDSPR